MKQFSGSASANVVTVVLLSLLLLLKKCVEKNKHSECKSCCFSISLDNKTERSKHHAEAQDDTEENSGDDEEGVRKLHGGDHRRVRTQSV